MFFAAMVVLMPSSRSRAGHLHLEDLADAHLVDPDVAVRVPLDRVEPGEILGRDAQHHALRR